jgi:hypothetical protein
MNRKLPPVLLVLLILCAGCGLPGSAPSATLTPRTQSGPAASPTPFPTLTPPGVPPTDPQLLNGTWRTDGYGWLLEIDNGVFQVYEQTSVSCLPAMDGPVEGNILALEDGSDVMAGIVEGKLELTWYDTLAISADRPDALPEACTISSTQDNQDPEWNFEVLWHTFAEHYAFFDLYQVDWQAQYETYRPLVTASTTMRELFVILSDLVEPLSDPHIYLARGPATRYSPDRRTFGRPPGPTWRIYSNVPICTVKCTGLAMTISSMACWTTALGI